MLKLDEETQARELSALREFKKSADELKALHDEYLSAGENEKCKRIRKIDNALRNGIVYLIGHHSHLLKGVVGDTALRSKRHREYWAVLTQVKENCSVGLGESETYTLEDLHNYFKLLLGYSVTVKIMQVDGAVVVLEIPKSIAFNRSNNADFYEYVRKFYSYVETRYGFGISHIKRMEIDNRQMTEYAYKREVAKFEQGGVCAIQASHGFCADMLANKPIETHHTKVKQEKRYEKMYGKGTQHHPDNIVAVSRHGHMKYADAGEEKSPQKRKEYLEKWKKDGAGTFK